MSKRGGVGTVRWEWWGGRNEAGAVSGRAVNRAGAVGKRAVLGRSRPLLLACALLALHALAWPLRAAAQAPGHGAPLWWPGFIDARDKAFLELPDDAKLCRLAREQLAGAARTASSGRTAGAADAARVPPPAALEPGRTATLPLKIETLLPRGARLTFGVIDSAGVTSERVFTHVVAIARGTDKGACAHLAEAGAGVPGYVAEEDRTAFGVHPPRPLSFRPPADGWKSYGAAAALPDSDARFAAAADAPPAWRTRVSPAIAAPLEVFGQRFHAVLERGRAPVPLTLTGAIAAAPEFDTFNIITRDDGAGGAAKPAGKEASEGAAVTLYQSGPSGGVDKNRSGSFVAQVLGALDLDGDGVDEIVLRARYYSGGNLKVLRLSGGKLVELRGSAYEGE